MTSMRMRIAVVVGSVALAATAAVGLATPAAAEQIGSIRTDVTISADTSFRVVETIQYDFGNRDRHGIFRDIPMYDEMPGGDRRVYGLTINSVTIDGQPVPVEQSEEAPFLHLRIGDPDETITGTHTYVIDYTVTDGLRVITAEDMEDPAMPANLAAGDVEMYWDLVGTGWEVYVDQADAKVTGPGEVLSAKCFAGAQGSSTGCPAAAAASTATYGPVSLAPEEGLTGVTVFPSSAFSRVPTANIQKGPINPVFGIAGGLIPALLLVFGPIGYALAKRRSDAGVVLPGAPPQYSPPDDLSPAEMVAGWTGNESSAHSRTLIATLVDLAARRWINLSSSGDDLEVTWVGTGTKPMRPWEESLVGVILKGQPSATMSGYDKELATLWAATGSQLASEAESSGRRNPTGDAPDQRWWWLALTAVIAFALTIAFAVFGVPFLAAGAATVGVGAAIGFVAARIITPRKETEQSAQYQAKVRGFQKVLGTDAASSRREFAQRLGLPPEAVFATMLPYAVVFGLENSWIGAFPDLTPDQLANYGFYYIGLGSLAGLIDSGTSSISSAMTAPSSGSGGGGFSGGGGGGGGGGSW